MPQLRWILIVFGGLLLLGIYLWGRRSSKQAAASEEALLRTPEQSLEPHRAYVFRDEPVVDVEEPVDDDVAADADLEPIVADRRPWHVDEAEVVEDEDFEEPATASSPPPAVKDKDVRRTRIEPRLGEEDAAADRQHTTQPAEPARATARESTREAAQAPTVSMSNTPQPRRSERRKIIALRIAAGTQRFAGEDLLAAMEAEGLQHGKYDVFHRLDDSGATLFSVASMVEPGTFDPLRMAGESFPGITLFTQFPGDCDSVLAFSALVMSAKNLHEKLGGALQDERGAPLTMHRLERLRQDIREFEQGQGRDVAHRETSPSTTP